MFVRSPSEEKRSGKCSAMSAMFVKPPTDQSNTMPRQATSRFSDTRGGRLSGARLPHSGARQGLPTNLTADRSLTLNKTYSIQTKHNIHACYKNPPRHPPISSNLRPHCEVLRWLRRPRWHAQPTARQPAPTRKGTRAHARKLPPLPRCSCLDAVQEKTLVESAGATLGWRKKRFVLGIDGKAAPETANYCRSCSKTLLELFCAQVLNKCSPSVPRNLFYNWSTTVLQLFYKTFLQNWSTTVLQHICKCQ